MTLSVGSFPSMSRNSKWIEVKSYDEPLADVARRALRSRMKSVWRWLRLAVKSSEDEIENVHQLRVATRRAMALLQIFSDVLPAHRSEWFQKQLKKIRRTAGTVRDLDVLAGRLKSSHEASEDMGLSSLIRRVELERDEAQPAISKLRKKLKRHDFLHRNRKMIRKIGRRGPSELPADYLSAAKSSLRPLATNFFAAADVNFDCISSLHQFRIAGKELRYAMEVFGAAFAPEFRDELYPSIEKLQELLGAVNDHANAQNSYLGWLDKTQDESERLVLSKLIAVESSALRDSIQRFRDWWTPARVSDLKLRFWQQVSPGELRCA
jgi:CHAD domain-containing protein